MDRIAVFGAQKERKQDVDNVKIRLNLSGNNTGNYLIGYSIDKQIDNCEFFRFSDKIDFKAMNENFDKVVVASSNFINSQQDLGKWADVLEKLDMPIVPIGLGAQALNQEEPLTIKKGTQRWLSIVSERCSYIGVRGEFTAEVLNKFNIKNTQIIGCPSAFMSLDRNFKIETQLKIQSDSQILVHGSPRPFQMFYIEYLLKIFSKYKMKFLAQTELKLLQLKSRSISISEIGNFMNLNKLSPDKLNDLLENTLFFDDVDLWKKYLEGVAFSIGGRFHGNMLAAQMKIPAIWIVHDTRTREFTDLYSFPSITMNELVNMSVEEIYERFSYDAFNNKYVGLYDNYVHFLNKNNLIHNL